jgi:hypothetical protein
MRDALNGLAAFILIPATVLWTYFIIKLWQSGLACKRLGHNWRYGAWHQPQISSDKRMWYRIDFCTRCPAQHVYHANMNKPGDVV